MTQKSELVRFSSTDGLKLSGLLFRPPRSREVAIFLHGNGGGSIFTSERTAALADALSRKGIAYFPFDNRGAGLVKSFRRKLGETKLGGMAFEKIAECRQDIDGAVRHLQSLGFSHFHLIGHSTGANKICLYDSAKRTRNPFSSYILFAPGDDVGIYHELLGSGRFSQLLKTARKKVSQGHGDELSASPGAPWLMSWGSILDTIDPDGDYNVFPFLEVMRDLRLSAKPLFRHFRRLSRPSLVVYGSEDEFCFGDVTRCVEILKENTGSRAPVEYKVVAGADHGFHGMEARLGRVFANWLGGLKA